MNVRGAGLWAGADTMQEKPVQRWGGRDDSAESGAEHTL